MSGSHYVANASAAASSVEGTKPRYASSIIDQLAPILAALSRVTRTLTVVGGSFSLVDCFLSLNWICCHTGIMLMMTSGRKRGHV